jgi:uroporphyrin-III C-methyltransferase/precorrin-2 dehydrogenase/sirohydrochlorin ferrochelatase
MDNVTLDPLYPTFLKLGGRKVVIVGGGPVAVAKHEALTVVGAAVIVVASSVRSELRRGGTVVFERPFEPADLDGAWFAVAAATPEVNQQVVQAAAERRIFVNAVDDPARATAYAGGVVRKGGVTVAISTEGAAPALAGLLREGLEALIPEDIAAWSETARDIRREHRRENVAMASRRPQLLEALNRLYTKSPDAEDARSKGMR